MKKNLVIIFLFLTTVGLCQDIQQNDFFLAQTYFRQGEYEKSAQLFEKLYNKSPFNTTYLQKLITCYQETNNFLKAENLLKTKLSKNKSQIYLYVLLGYNYERQELKEIAKNNYEKVINSLDNNAAYAGIIGRLFKDYNLLDYAITTYKKGMEKNPKSNYNFQIAQIYGEKGDFKQMFEYYINLIDKNVSYLNLIQRYAGRYITDDPENETNVLFRKTLLRKAASNPKDEWNILLSWLFTQQKDYSKALTQEKALYQRKPEKLTEIFKLGKIAFDDKNFEAAIECFNFIDQKTTLREEKIEANLYLAKIKVTNKEEDVELFFRMLFKNFGENSETIDLQVAYADYLTFYKNNPDKATIILEKALSFAKNKFEKARIKLKLGDVFVFRGKYNTALIYFSQIQTKLKNHELAQQARFKVAQTSYYKGDFTWAKAQLKVLKGSTTQLIANDAVDLFLKITDNEPVDSIPSGLKQLAKAELLFYQNKNDDALQEIENLFSSKDILLNGLVPGEVIYDDVLYLQSKLYLKQEKYIEIFSRIFFYWL